MSTPRINVDIVGVEYVDDPTALVPSKTWEVTETQILGYIDGLDAMAQWVRHVIMTEYNERHYLTDYGFEKNQFIGERRSYVLGVYRTYLDEALSRDDRYVRIENFETEEGEQREGILFRFTVVTTLGAIATDAFLELDGGL